jgi:hypothetical protein
MYGGFEQRYHVPFGVANATIYDFMATIHNGEDFYHRESPGIVQYDLVLFPNPGDINLPMRVSVMQLTENATIVRARPYLAPNQTFDAIAERSDVDHAIKSFFFSIQEVLLQTVRYTHPDLTIHEIRGITPPRPTRDKGLPAIVAWKDKYLREVPDRAFAEEIGVTEQTLRNARQKNGQAKVLRGKVRQRSI